MLLLLYFVMHNGIVFLLVWYKGLICFTAAIISILAHGLEVYQ